MWAKLGRWVHFGAWVDVDVALAVRICGESVWVVLFVHLHHDSRSKLSVATVEIVYLEA